MIERYTLPEMGTIWTAENRFRIWLDIELAACEALARRGDIPQAAVTRMKKKAGFDIGRIQEIEREVKHDVIAFLTSVAEHIGEPARYMHLGMTSSDVLDTGLAVQLKQAGRLIAKELQALRRVLKRRALEFKHTPVMGRSHGIHAEPTTFGLKLANWYEEVGRNQQRLKAALERVAVGQVSGAVGVFAGIEPEVEAYVCKKLGLKPAAVSSQVIQRDRHAEFFGTLAVIATSIDKFAIEVRHLQRTEVLEAEEFFSKGQKGSSAMPHKRNPILSEQMSGLARVVRSHAQAALENMLLWHERDISHSSVERIIAPDGTILVHYMLRRFTGLMDQLIVYPENMKRNLEKTGGLIFSEHVLLALCRKGLDRDTAYRMVQRHAMRVWERGGDFKALLKKDKEIRKWLSARELDRAFDMKHHLRNVDKIFKRVFNN